MVKGELGCLLLLSTYRRIFVAIGFDKRYYSEITSHGERGALLQKEHASKNS